MAVFHPEIEHTVPQLIASPTPLIKEASRNVTAELKREPSTTMDKVSCAFVGLWFDMVRTCRKSDPFPCRPASISTCPMPDVSGRPKKDSFLLRIVHNAVLGPKGEIGRCSKVGALDTTEGSTSSVTLTLISLFCNTEMYLSWGYGLQYGSSMLYLHPFHVRFIAKNEWRHFFSPSLGGEISLHCA